MADDKDLYDLLSMLDRLEELREDLQELELTGGTLDDGSSDDLREELAALGVDSLAGVERRIAELNAQIELTDDREGSQV